ncbi:MAG TPA: hydroxymethylglutaryl-CoA reductase, degradative [Polyangiaceae bacterium]|nr:hydroxymethylglutaryl-CoA reductase, degradative [Polyangiaceae bacterium]
MNDSGSRIPGFYKLSLDERRQVVAGRTAVELDALVSAAESGGLDSHMADKLVENVLGIYGLPFGLALNVRVNARDHLVPMVIEEPSVIAAASNAARMVRASGGFHAEMLDSLMTAQVELRDVHKPFAAIERLEQEAPRLLELARAAVPNLISRGGGPREIEIRDLGRGCLVLHIYLDCKDAMGANLANTVAEAIGPVAASLTGGVLGLRILSNLCDRRRVRASCRVHAGELVFEKPRDRSSEAPAVRLVDGEAAPALSGTEIAERIVLASRFAELDPYRAATHNKGVMNGIDAVVLATGNDFRAVEAGAHAYAARSGRYAPLSTWRKDGEDLVGELELPLALGTVGGTLRVHPTAQLSLRISGVRSADELSMLAASVGLASNLAALRALATEGIQRGHMSLHARSVAVAAGARGDEVERVTAVIVAENMITLEAAQATLLKLRLAEL